MVVSCSAGWPEAEAAFSAAWRCSMGLPNRITSRCQNPASIVDITMAHDVRFLPKARWFFRAFHLAASILFPRARRYHARKREKYCTARYVCELMEYEHIGVPAEHVQAHFVPSKRSTPDFEGLGDCGMEHDLLCDAGHCVLILYAAGRE